MEADKELERIIQYHTKAVTGKNLFYPIGTQEYFTANKLIAWRDRAVVAELNKFKVIASPDQRKVIQGRIAELTKEEGAL